MLYRCLRHTDGLMPALADELTGRPLRAWRPTGERRHDVRALLPDAAAARLEEVRAAEDD
ncbi:hypothetical protein ABZ719_20275 [Streptomyces sp. NPDC006743]|uniref:hypothetical protein n=1 Tax=Streptomyces sp. NPDC006743 TaxID=3154480 RepID=UPI0034551D3F